MIPLIPRPLHAATDYLFSAAIIAAPKIGAFEDEAAAKLVCQAVGAGSIGFSLCTRYELGLVKLIPFKVHLLLDLMAALFSLSSPWLLGFASNKKARNTILGFALFELVALALSRSDNSDE